jgi:hypothetical protein
LVVFHRQPPINLAWSVPRSCYMSAEEDARVRRIAQATIEASDWPRKPYALLKVLPPVSFYSSS